jgi:hypothetical protein
VCGKRFSAALIHRINDAVAEDSSLSRAQLAHRVCEWLDWTDPKGRPQNSSASVALGKLADRGLITLPAKRFTRKKAAPKLPKEPVPAPLDLPKTLRGIKGLHIVQVNAVDNPEASEIWNWLMLEQHPQGRRPVMGRQIRYLIQSDHGVLGAAAFSAPAWRLSARDQFIGWSEPAREDNLQRVVSMSRFLIREEVSIDNLASHLLGLFAGQLPGDWLSRYGEKPLLLESFIDPGHFSGSCYRAANWLFAGQTKGRGRQDRNHENLSTRKDVYLYPLAPGWQAELCASPRAPEQGALEPLDYHTGLGGETGWAYPEFENTELGDKRLSTRVAQIAGKRFLNPGDGAVTGLGETALIKGAYRFFESEREELTIDNILAGHYQCTTRRTAAHEVVLCSQDSTRLNYDGLKETTGLGAMSGNQTGHQAQGLHLHSTLALTTTGIPLGLIDAQCWARLTEAEKQKRQDDNDSERKCTHRSVEEKIQEKESYRWMHSYEQSDAIAQRVEGLTVVNVSDREGDIYSLFAEAKKPHRKAHILVRANHNRALNDDDEEEEENTSSADREQADQENLTVHLWPHLKNQPAAGTIKLNLPKTQTRPKRKATLEVRYAKITLKAPTKKQANLPLWAVYVSEPSPEEGAPPVEWMLLTTMEITSAEQAFEIVSWYCHRWKIEELHRVLKSGCRIEAKQLKTAEALKRAIAIDLVVGWRILLLSKLSREHPDLPASVAFSQGEIEVLKIFKARRERSQPGTAQTTGSANSARPEQSVSAAVTSRSATRSAATKKNATPPATTQTRQ